jgi:squalene synthase HpnC
MLLLDAPPGVPAARAVMARAAGENFPVASRVLPRGSRQGLLALYGFARLADELGDGDGGSSTDRLAALAWLEDELARAYAGRATHPLLARLQPVLRECALPREPFARLIEANRVDQRVARYETWEQLLGYCELSANPVGELVLGIFGKATPARVALSDRICTALQLAEHWQDVAEDFRRGRVYLPGEDRARFGCREGELAGGQGAAARGGGEHASGPGGGDVEDAGGAGDAGNVRGGAGRRLRGLLAFEVARTRALLAEGLPLIATLSGRERLAVAAFAGGARAALDAVERASYDVLAGAPRASRSRRLAAAAHLLIGARALGERRG